METSLVKGVRVYHVEQKDILEVLHDVEWKNIAEIRNSLLELAVWKGKPNKQIQGASIYSICCLLNFLERERFVMRRDRMTKENSLILEFRRTIYARHNNAAFNRHPTDTNIS